MSRENLLGLFQAHQGVMLHWLSVLVGHESPSRDKPALDGLAKLLADRLQRTGAEVEIRANPEGGDHVLGRVPGPSAQRPALVLGHFDTVWPRGTLEKMPFSLE